MNKNNKIKIGVYIKLTEEEYKNKDFLENKKKQIIEEVEENGTREIIGFYIDSINTINNSSQVAFNQLKEDIKDGKIDELYMGFRREDNL